MKQMLSVACLVTLILCAGPAETQEPKAKPAVTLSLLKVRGVEFFSTPLEGPMKGQKVREVVLACDVVLDNPTGEDLTVLSNFSSAFDGLSIVVLKEGKELRTQSYISHQAPFSIEKRPHVLKKGKNNAHLRFPISAAPDDWANLEVSLIGDLPDSKFDGNLTSNTKKVEKVADLNK